MKKDPVAFVESLSAEELASMPVWQKKVLALIARRHNINFRRRG